MGRGSAKQKVVSATSGVGLKSSMVPPELSPGADSARRGTRGQLSAGAKAVGTELPKGASVRNGKINLDSSLAEVPLEPRVSGVGGGVTHMNLVDSSADVEAALATINEQEALSISLPVAAHTTNPCTLPLQEVVANVPDTNGAEQMCKQRPPQPTRSHIIPHHRTSSHCNAV